MLKGVVRPKGLGVDWAALITGLGLGLTIALQLTTMRRSDINSVYGDINTLSRLCALVGTYFALLGIFLVSRIPWVEEGVGHDRLITWHCQAAANPFCRADDHR